MEAIGILQIAEALPAGETALVSIPFPPLYEKTFVVPVIGTADTANLRIAKDGRMYINPSSTMTLPTTADIQISLDGINYEVAP